MHNNYNTQSHTYVTKNRLYKLRCITHKYFVISIIQKISFTYYTTYYSINNVLITYIKTKENVDTYRLLHTHSLIYTAI